MTEERYALEKVVESCKSMSELNGKLDGLESKALEFAITTEADGSINIAAIHCEAKLSTTDGTDGRTKPIIEYVDQPWHWYNIMPPKGFIFD